MKLIENMNAEELQTEIENQTDILNKALLKINELHGRRDYSDEIADNFHLGLVEMCIRDSGYSSYGRHR